jgi:hypothetical protein
MIARGEAPDPKKFPLTHFLPEGNRVLTGALKEHTSKSDPDRSLLKIIPEAREYESRLWGGAYDVSTLQRAARDAPIRKMIPAARERYNAIRQELGLPPVTDWAKRPDDLVQFMKE